MLTSIHMHNFTHTSVENKKATIALLFKLMAADHDEDLKELAYIMHIGDRLGLSDEDLKEVSLDVDSYTLDVPQDEMDRVTILYYLLFLTKADGEIRLEEESFLYRFSMKLGFRPEMITELISLLKRYIDQSVPPEELFGKIKMYFN